MSWGKKLLSAVLTFFFHQEFNLIEGFKDNIPFMSDLQGFFSEEIIENLLGFINVIVVFIGSYILTSIIIYGLKPKNEKRQKYDD